MSSEIDWSKAPEGATHYTMCSSAINPYLMLNDEGWHYYTTIEGWRPYLAGWCDEHTSDVVERPASPAWTGQGLPPVGVVCEYNFYIAQFGDSWDSVTVIAHDVGSTVFRANGNRVSKHFSDDRPEMFRPIRTPEQIAAEEREKAVDEMVAVWKKTMGRFAGEERGLAKMLYDHGYRKTEAGK